MSEAQALYKHYQIVRERLRNPPNAVPDTGINLRAGRLPPQPTKAERPKLILPVIDYSQVVPFRRLDLTFSSVLEATAKEFNITFKEIRSRSRLRAISLPRHVAIWLNHKITSQSLMSMGKYLGMDHTSMLYARKRVIDLMKADGKFSRRLRNLEKKLLAAFPRTVLPPVRKSHLGSPASEGTETV